MKRAKKAARGALACLLSAALMVNYSSIAYAFDESEATGATTTEEQTDSSAVSTDESVSSEEAADTAEAEEASDSVTTDNAVSLEVPTVSALSEVSLLSVAANVDYIDEEGTTQSAASATVVDEDTTTWSGGWYVVDSTVEITSRITVSGEVHLILADGAKLTASAGISVNENNSLTIYAQSTKEDTMGSLTATGAANCAGIGSDSDGSGNAYSSGAITINGGNITATGGRRAAGIGGGSGYSSDGGGNGQNITINGGVVTATGGQSAAGIGGGMYGGGYNITINGATATVKGGGSFLSFYGGAGIGGGGYGDGENIAITDSKVIASGSSGFDSGAGIGGGCYGSAYNITIKDSNVEATGGRNGAGIGAGLDGSSASYITIDGGTVEATGGYWAAGIGGGHYDSDADHITIKNATVIATGSTNCAGIGGSQGGDGTNIEIINSNVTAAGGSNGAGIGGGYGGSGSRICITGGSTVEASGGSWAAGIGGGYNASGSDITVTDSTVTATSASNGAGIGGGGDWGSGYDITITDSTVIAEGGSNGAGIGGGRYGDGHHIEITNSNVTATGGANAAGIGGGGISPGENYNGGSGYNITINSGTVTATGGENAAGIGGGYSGDGTDITISGGIVTAEGDTNADAIGSGYGGSTATGITVNYGDAGYYWRASSSAAFTSSATLAISLPGDYTYVQIYPTDAIAESILFNTNSKSIVIGATLDLSSGEYLTVSPSTYNLDYAIWSSDSDCVTVDSGGTITGVSAGTATITVSNVMTASGSEATASITITVNKITPTASDFVFTAPSDLTYDGQAKEASVSVAEGITGMGEITSIEYSSDGKNWDSSAPVYPGTYLVRITVAEGSNYTEATVKSDEWTFSITKSGWTRLAGEDRYETMVEVVKEAFGDDSSDYVVIASGQNFPDSLTASSLAGVLDAPIILVSDSLTEEAIEQIARLGATQAYIVGGPASVSASAATQIADITGMESVERVSGADRYATAVEVAKETASLLAEQGETVDTVILASGAVYADALSISPYAYTKATPIILVGSDGLLDDASLNWITSSDATSLIVAGGTASVADAAITQTGISGSERLAGSDRYATSVAIANWAIKNEDLSADGLVVASGTTFPDALAASALCGQFGSVLLLASNSSTVATSVISANADSITYAYFVGGTDSVSTTVANTFVNASKISLND